MHVLLRDSINDHGDFIVVRDKQSVDRHDPQSQIAELAKRFGHALNVSSFSVLTRSFRRLDQANEQRRKYCFPGSLS
jgi:hypothetical protein